jgi:uncharacterized membrane protein YdcZ (DUF606 family)
MDIALTLKALNILAAMLWLVSAGLWALGAMVETRDNPDAFISDLQRAGRWNSWAAGMACAAALVTAAVAFCECFAEDWLFPPPR